MLKTFVANFVLWTSKTLNISYVAFPATTRVKENITPHSFSGVICYYSIFFYADITAVV